MRLISLAVAPILLGLALFVPLGRLQAEIKLPEASASPAALVQAALQAELGGPSDARGALLAEALKRDPNFAPARWQSGFVQWDRQWLSIDEVPKRAADDKQLAAYRKRRDGMVDTAENQQSLAKWCRKNKLPDEERIHWAKVLEFEPGNAEALSGLGLQLHDGRLLTRKQIEQEKQRAGERLRAAQFWQPKVVKWRNAIDHGSPKERAEALEELGSLSDPEAIAPLESAFAVNAKSNKSDELNLLLIETVGHMPQSEATQVLLRRAIVPDSLEVRTAAADELKKRPMHAYVPQLIAAMPSSLKTRFYVYVLPGGMVLHEHELYIEGQRADLSITYQSVVNPTDAATAMLITPRAVNAELQSATALEASARPMYKQSEFLRDRLQFALERTTGFTRADDPQLWEKQYNDYYGWHKSPEAKPIYNRTYAAAQVYFTKPVSSTTTTTYSNVPLPPIAHNYCFPPGALVVALRGLTAIEEIKPGDRVLSQNIETGELVYKPVQETTLRPAIPLVRISLGSQSIVATPGHPFWIVGQGWQTAKHLKVGMLLHGTKGAMLIDKLEPARPSEVYNLIVSDFHNYFVGESPVLVHDNSPLEDTAALPGLAVQSP